MNNFLIDAHCDTITRLMEDNKELIKNNCHIDIEKLKNFNSPVQFFAIWLQPKYYENPMQQTLKYIDFYNTQLKKYSEFIDKAESVKDIEKNRNCKKISAILTIEGGEAIESISSLQLLYNLGVRAVALTWNNSNKIAGGIEENQKGITDFGYSIVSKMNKLGMIVDVSHLSEKSFWDFDKVAENSYIASHSNAKKLCNNRRNLTDEQIKAIANKNGVIGINLYSGFLSNNETSTVEDILKHMDYIIKLVGSDYVGFGCDFDGIDKTPELVSDVSKLELVIEKIITLYGDCVAEKILNNNFMRVIKNVWK